jgi:hypothetical protein
MPAPLQLHEIRLLKMAEREQRMNCWEFKKCGRETDCPAYPDHGTECARVTGTLYEGKVQGIFGMKLTTCMHCDYYRSPHYLLELRTVSRNP